MAIGGRHLAVMEKRSLTLAGHRTSMALEPAFWAALDMIASERGLPLAALVREIDEARVADGAAAVNLASAARLHVLAWYRQALEAHSDRS